MAEAVLGQPALFGKFVNDVLAGEASADDVWAYVHRWSNEAISDITLPDYLGFSRDEMKIWMRDKSVLTLFIEARRPRASE